MLPTFVFLLRCTSGLWNKECRLLQHNHAIATNQQGYTQLHRCNHHPRPGWTQCFPMLPKPQNQGRTRQANHLQPTICQQLTCRAFLNQRGNQSNNQFRQYQHCQRCQWSSQASATSTLGGWCQQSFMVVVLDQEEQISLDIHQEWIQITYVWWKSSQNFPMWSWSTSTSLTSPRMVKFESFDASTRKSKPH